MEDEQEIVQLTMQIFESMRRNESNNAWRNWLKILPNEMLQGTAMHLIRQYFKQRSAKSPLSTGEKHELADRTATLIINELLKKEREIIRATYTTGGAKRDEDRDGAELFYRRALKHMAMERYFDAERYLKRAVEICPNFSDAWETYAEILELNGKEEHAAAAREVLAKRRSE